MVSNKNGKTRRVCVMLTEEDYKRLARLAQESSRTAPGFIRWLLHRHFREPEGRQKK